MSGPRWLTLAALFWMKLTVSERASYGDLVKGHADKTCSHHLTTIKAALIVTWFMSEQAVSIDTLTN